MPENQNPAEVVRELRDQALSARASYLGLQRRDSNVWGVLMETGYAEAVVTLACFADGATSLYFSTGGGMIGAGEHESVRAAAEALLKTANDHLPELAPANDHPQPGIGRVRFYVHTFDGLLTAERDQNELGYGRDPLSPLFRAGHEVMAAIREL